jgi:hypothetical protein
MAVRDRHRPDMAYRTTFTVPASFGDPGDKSRARDQRPLPARLIPLRDRTDIGPMGVAGHVVVLTPDQGSWWVR